VTVCAAFRNFGRGLLERRIALRMRRVKYRTSGAGLSAMTEQQQQQLTQATEAKAQKHRARLHSDCAGGTAQPYVCRVVLQFRVAEHSDFTTIAE
jgi:hypothetical protein